LADVFEGKVVMRNKVPDPEPVAKRSSQLADILRGNIKLISNLGRASTLQMPHVSYSVYLSYRQPCSPAAPEITYRCYRLKMIRIHTSSMKALSPSGTSQIFVMALMINLKTLSNGPFISLVIQAVSQDRTALHAGLAVSRFSNASLPNPAAIFRNHKLGRRFPTVVTVYKRQWLALNMSVSECGLLGDFSRLTTSTLT
jgi:hypothetical protein